MFIAQKFSSNDKGDERQRTEILKDGPGEGSLFEAVNGLPVACAVKLVVEEAMLAQKILSKLPEDYRQLTEILKSGPGEDSLFEAVNGCPSPVRQLCCRYDNIPIFLDDHRAAVRSCRHRARQSSLC